MAALLCNEFSLSQIKTMNEVFGFGGVVTRVVGQPELNLCSFLPRYSGTGVGGSPPHHPRCCSCRWWGLDEKKNISNILGHFFCFK